MVALTILYTNEVTSTIQEQNNTAAIQEVEQKVDNIKADLLFIEELSNQVYFNTSLARKLLVEYNNPGDCVEIYVDDIYPQLRQNLYLQTRLIDSIAIYTENETFLADGEYVIELNEYMDTHWFGEVKEHNGTGQII